MSSTRSLIPRLTAGLSFLAAIDAGVLPAQGASRLTSATTVGTANAAAPVVPTSRAPADTVAAPRHAGPRIAQAAFHVPALATEFSPPPFNDGSMGAGKNVAMMGVGAAGLITGLLIGGTSGTVIAISGGIIGLYGLYHFLQ